MAKTGHLANVSHLDNRSSLLIFAILGGNSGASTAVRGVSIDGMALELDVIVGELPELNVIDAQLFLGGVNTELQTGDQVDQEKNDAREDKGPGETGAAIRDLIAELDKVSANPTGAGEGGV